MAYITFAKTDIVVLNAFDAAAYINYWCEFNNRKPFSESEFDDALNYGIQGSVVTPLRDDQFKEWSLENVGNIVRYPVAYLARCARTGEESYYFVRICKDSEKALQMFGERWRKIRTCTLRFTVKCDN